MATEERKRQIKAARARREGTAADESEKYDATPGDGPRTILLLSRVRAVNAITGFTGTTMDADHERGVDLWWDDRLGIVGTRIKGKIKHVPPSNVSEMIFADEADFDAPPEYVPPPAPPVPEYVPAPVAVASPALSPLQIRQMAARTAKTRKWANKPIDG